MQRFTNYAASDNFSKADEFMMKALQEAYVAGWNACRDQWGGLDYNQTYEQERMNGR